MASNDSRFNSRNILLDVGSSIKFLLDDDQGTGHHDSSSLFFSQQASTARREDWGMPSKKRGFSK
jgi:hypothetical protein